VELGQDGRQVVTLDRIVGANSGEAVVPQTNAFANVLERHTKNCRQRY